MQFLTGVRFLFAVSHHSSSPVLHYSKEKGIYGTEWLFHSAGSRATSRASGIALTR